MLTVSRIETCFTLWKVGFLFIHSSADEFNQADKVLYLADNAQIIGSKKQPRQNPHDRTQTRACALSSKPDNDLAYLHK
jgi:hypothetical protein